MTFTPYHVRVTHITRISCHTTCIAHLTFKSHHIPSILPTSHTHQPKSHAHITSYHFDIISYSYHTLTCVSAVCVSPSDTIHQYYLISHPYHDISHQYHVTSVAYSIASKWNNIKYITPIWHLYHITALWQHVTLLSHHTTFRSHHITCTSRTLHPYHIHRATSPRYHFTFISHHIMSTAGTSYPHHFTSHHFDLSHWYYTICGLHHACHTHISRHIIFISYHIHITPYFVYTIHITLYHYIWHLYHVTSLRIRYFTVISHHSHITPISLRPTLISTQIFILRDAMCTRRVSQTYHVTLLLYYIAFILHHTGPTSHISHP